jgi:hypothetical protein
MGANLVEVPYLLQRDFPVDRTHADGDKPKTLSNVTLLAAELPDRMRHHYYVEMSMHISI